MQIIPTVNVHEDIYYPHVSHDVTKQILESKRPVIGEIELTLFENCNIECDFCFHDKKSIVGMTKPEMLAKLDTIEAHLLKFQDRVDLMQVNVVGGELFQDSFIDEMSDHYFDLMVEVKKLFDQYNHKMNVVWVSNFLFVKREVIKHLIDRLNAADIPSSLIVSYDFSGRPMSRNYRKNIEFFGPEYISSVNAVATRESVKRFIELDDPFFDWMYDTFEIYFDTFIPDKGTDDQIPTDSMLYEFYVYIIDNYPKINPISDVISGESSPMHCLSLNKITIFPDGSTANCRWHRYDQSDFVTELNINDNAGMMQRFIDTNGCLSCEYYHRCGLRCFTQWDWANRKSDMDGCLMKAVFDKVSQK